MGQTWEVEQKFHVDDLAAVEKRLGSAGFELQEIQTHSDVYFRHPCRDFRTTDEAFRLRRINDDCVVTYKGARLDSTVKMRPEMELAIQSDEFEQWQQVFKHLGFVALPEVRKDRRVFRASSDSNQVAEVTLDQVHELGVFAEVELLVSDRDALGEAQAEIIRIAALLGLDQPESRSYLAQYLAKLGLE